MDRVSTSEFESCEGDYLYKLWNRMSAGSYMPSPVRAVETPKDHGTGGAGCGGSVDLAGHPTGAHACLRPEVPSPQLRLQAGRSQHDAVKRARQFIADDAAWCVDFDLDSFFDRVQHDALIGSRG